MSAWVSAESVRKVRKEVRKSVGRGEGCASGVKECMR